MTDPTDSDSHRHRDRPGPDVDLTGIETRVDENSGTVTFLTRRDDRDATTAWLTVDADDVVDVADWR